MHIMCTKGQIAKSVQHVVLVTQRRYMISDVVFWWKVILFFSATLLATEHRLAIK